MRPIVVLSIITLINAFLITLSIHEGHNWGGDFAMYIDQARSIMQGTTAELYAANKFAMQNSVIEIGPYLYPFGFPLLLSLVYAVFGLNFVAMKVFCSLFLLAALPFLYKLFKQHFSNPYYSLFIVAAIAFHVDFVSFTDHILSDLSFFFFSICSLYLMHQKPTIKNQLLLGTIIFYAWFIRDIGLFLLPVLAVLQYQIHKQHQSLITIQKWGLITLPYFVFLSFALLATWLFPTGTSNHYEMLFSSLSVELVTSNILYYVKIIFNYFFQNSLPIYMSIPVALIMVVGIISTRNKSLYLLVYITLNMIVLLLWPSKQGVRFVFTLIPVFLYFVLEGALFLFQKWQIKSVYLHGALLLWLGLSSFRNIQNIVRHSDMPTNDCYTEEMQSVYTYIKENIPEHQITGFEKPRVLRMFTDQNAVFIRPKDFNQSVANYLLTEKNIPVETEYQIVFETPSYVLYAKQYPNSFCAHCTFDFPHRCSHPHLVF